MFVDDLAKFSKDLLGDYLVNFLRVLRYPSARIGHYYGSAVERGLLVLPSGAVRPAGGDLSPRTTSFAVVSIVLGYLFHFALERKPAPAAAYFTLVAVVLCYWLAFIALMVGVCRILRGPAKGFQTFGIIFELLAVTFVLAWGLTLILYPIGRRRLVRPRNQTPPLSLRRGLSVPDRNGGLRLIPSVSGYSRFSARGVHRHLLRSSAGVRMATAGNTHHRQPVGHVD
jgi:hypothetical protein